MQSFFMRTTKTLIRLCANAQADLSLQWVRMSEVRFSTLRLIFMSYNVVGVTVIVCCHDLTLGIHS